MCAADKEVFSSFAHAQVSITNEIYQYLGEPDTFLFCPTGKTLGLILLCDSFEINEPSILLHPSQKKAFRKAVTKRFGAIWKNRHLRKE